MCAKLVSSCAILIITAFAGRAFARPPVTPPTYATLYTNSDLVCVLRVTKVVESLKAHPTNPYPKDWKSYVATCKVLFVFKGDSMQEEIQVPFYGHIFDLPERRGPAPLVETTGKNQEFIQYLAFLKHGRAGAFVPSGGDLDAAFSFRVLFESFDFDALEVLRKRQSPQNDAGPADASKPKPSSATGSRR